jgi:hypothetical protein
MEQSTGRKGKINLNQFNKMKHEEIKEADTLKTFRRHLAQTLIRVTNKVYSKTIFFVWLILPMFTVTK